MNKKIKGYAYSGLFSIILMIPLAIIEILNIFIPMPKLFYLISCITILVLDLVFWVYFIYGFSKIAEKTKNDILRISSYMVIISSVILYISLMISKILSANGMIGASVLLALIPMWIFAITNIPFGIGMLKLENKLGNLATATGILLIIYGGSIASIIFFFFALLVTIPLVILSLILMFKAAEKIK